MTALSLSDDDTCMQQIAFRQVLLLHGNKDWSYKLAG